MVNGNIEIKQDTLIITYMTRGIKGDRDYFIKYNLNDYKTHNPDS